MRPLVTLVGVCLVLTAVVGWSRPATAEDPSPRDGPADIGPTADGEPVDVHCAASRPAAAPTFSPLGTAVEGFPVNAAVRDGDTAYLMSMDLLPGRLLTYDLATRQVTAVAELSVALRTWAMTVAGQDVYLGLWNRPGERANLYRYEPAGRSFTAVGRVPSDLEFWSLDAAPDGTLYAGTDQPAVHEVDPATGDVTAIPLPVEPDTQVAAVVATADTVYARTRGTGAGVYAVDRASGTVSVLRDPADSGSDGVYSLALGVAGLAVGATGPDATVEVLDPATGAVTARDVADDDTAIDTLAVADDGTVWATAKPSGRLYRLVDGALAQTARPLGDAPTRALFAGDGTVTGVSAAETVWTATADGVSDRTNLLDAGAPGEPVAVMSLLADDGQVLAGGNNRLHVHDPAEGTVERRVVPGEPKDLAAAVDAVYLALYPYAELWSYRDGTLAEEADWPDRYNRPRDAAASPTRIRIGVHDDAAGGGALVTYVPATGQHDTAPDALDGRGIATVVDHATGTYLGSEGDDASVVALVPGTDTVRWDAVPAPGAGEVTGLAVHAGQVHVVTRGGAYAVLDAATGAVVHTAQVFDSRGGEMVVNGGHVYAVSRDRLVRIDPATQEVEILRDDLDALTFQRPRLSLDADCRLYLLDGAEILQVEV